MWNRKKKSLPRRRKALDEFVEIGNYYSE